MVNAHKLRKNITVSECCAVCTHIEAGYTAHEVCDIDDHAVHTNGWCDKFEVCQWLKNIPAESPKS